jgi:alpha-mannosidase
MDGCEQTFVSSLLSKIDRLRDLSQVNVLAGWRIDAVADLPTPPCRVPLLGGDFSEGSKIVVGVPLARTERSRSVGTLLNGNLASLNEKGFVAWERSSQEIWLGQRLVLPAHVQGYPVAGLVCRLALTWWAELAQVFVNGVLVQEGDLFDHSARMLLTAAVVPGTAVEVWLRLVSPAHDRGALMRSRLVYESLDPTFPEPGWLADELAVMVKQIAAFHPAGLEEVGSIIDRIDYALLMQDSHQFIQQLLEIKQQIKLVIDRHALETVGGGRMPPVGGGRMQSAPTVKLLGHAHLDMAWLWEVAETWEVAERTFSSAVNLQQDYPQLSFCHSTPALYEWIETHKPELFDRICQQIKVGTWEVVGGMWIEPDLNLISGESIARQIIYGQRYNQAKFGELTRVAWLPDTFGFCRQLPQLLLQGGIEYFVTQKFQWNDTTKFPHQLFWWEALDGSRILSLMSSAIGEGIDPLKMIDYACGWQTSTGIDESLWLFGVGDHGGGPTRDMLELADRWSKSDVFPDLEFTTAVKYLDKLASRADSQDLPVWQDDLYLEFHRGCFTTHADQKRSNRQCEDLLYQAELWSTLASIITQQSYSDELKLQLETAWKQTLLNQFHDIIPGTAIEPVYVTANEGWANVERVTTQIIGDALSQISDRISLPIPPIAGAIPIVIFNALNWHRTEVIEYPLTSQEEVGFRSGWRVFDADGKSIPTQSSAEYILFLATLPSVGYKLFWLAPIAPLPVVCVKTGVPAGGGGFTTSAATPTETVGSSDFIFKNQFVRVEIDPATGDIASLWDEINQCEVLSGHGNQLQAFKDSDQYWDAWNIDPKYAEHQLPPSQLKSHGSPSAPAIEWIETGAIRQRLRVVRVLAGCEFSQDYILDAHSPILQIKTSVEWQARHVLIKANFPLNLTADKSTAEMACGAISRTTKPETEAEQAKWELPMHRWIDLTDNAGGYGVSLLNDCKYGYDAGTDYLRLTLLRGTEWPDPVADRGYHEFTYAIYPHAGTWQAAQTVRKGYELNSPLQVVEGMAGTERSRSGGLGAVGSFIDLDAENLVLMAFKPSDSIAQSWIIRCYEAHGVDGNIELTGDMNLQIDREVNLFDEPQSDRLDSKIKPWQIRSFGVK